MEKQSFFFMSLCVIIVVISTSSSCVSAQLREDFYRNSCSNVETLVRNAVTNKFRQTFVTAPATLRLFFHDCFVRVCKITNSPSMNSLYNSLSDCCLCFRDVMRRY